MVVGGASWWRSCLWDAGSTWRLARAGIFWAAPFCVSHTDLAHRWVVAAADSAARIAGLGRLPVISASAIKFSSASIGSSTRFFALGLSRRFGWLMPLASSPLPAGPCASFTAFGLRWRACLWGGRGKPLLRRALSGAPCRRGSAGTSARPFPGTPSVCAGPHHSLASRT